MADDAALDAEAVAVKQFNTARRGFDQHEVRAYLATLADELRGSREREDAANARVSELEAGGRPTAPLATEDLEAAVGAETTRVLHAAREASAEIRSRAEESVSRMLREAQDEAAAMRAEASSVLARLTDEAEAGAASIVEAAQQRGREMVAEAQAVRDRMLKDLSRRRRQAEAQVEALAALRQQMVDAFDVAAAAAARATSALAAAGPLAVESDAADADPAGEGEHEPPPATATATATAPAVEAALPAAEPATPAVVVPTAAEPDPPRHAPVGVGEVLRDQPSPVVVVDDVVVDDATLVDEPAEDELADEEPVPTGPEPALRSVPAVPANDERRSSSLRLLRRRPEPVPNVPFDDDDVERVRIIRPERPVLAPLHPSPALGNDAEPPPSHPAAEPVVDEDDDDDRPVDDLFARLRADRAAAVAEAEEILARPTVPAAAAVVADETVPTVVSEAAQRDAVFEQRDAAVEEAERALVRSLKRALSDEQNEVLDALRRHRGRPDVEGLLPDPAVHRARYAAVASEALHTGASAGAAVHQARPPKVDALGEALGDDIATDLRNRVTRAIEGGRDDEALVEAISATYREWKATRSEPFAHHHVAAAYAFGSYESAPDGPMAWLVDPAEGGCPDCDDNALAGPTPKGERYPTGQLHPPAHAGCRCLLVNASH